MLAVLWCWLFYAVSAEIIYRDKGWENFRLALFMQVELPYKNEKVAAGCSSVAATMQQSNMYATTGGDKVAN